jgi:anaerobic selenocysteine-containing dehydrogenase
MEEKKEKIGLCKIQYHDQCQVKFRFDENGNLLPGEAVEGSPLQPWMTMDGCVRQRYFLEWNFHKDRLNYPLKRVGKRGENKWQQISWNQALDEIADKLKEIKEKYGSEYFGLITGFYNHQWDVARFGNLYGTPNVDSVNARICGGLETWMNVITYGHPAQYGPPYPEYCNLLTVWANRPSDMYPIKWAKGQLVKRRIVVDPRWVRECKGADFWLQIRPGTDAALALGWMNVIINEELYDKKFVEKWTYGFDKLKERVQEYPPKRVSEITWIPEEKIIESARFYAKNSPAHIQWGSPTGYYGLNSDQTERARCCLRAITGNVGTLGGNYFNTSYSKQVKLHDMELEDMLPEDKMKKALGSDQFRGMTWPAYYMIPEKAKGFNRAFINRGAPLVTIINSIRTGKPYQIKGLILTAGNIMATVSQSKHVYEALKKVDFYACIELVMTPTAMLADYVLPATSWLESPQLGFLEHKNILYTGQRVLPKSVQGKYDRRDDYDIWRDLGIRLGQEKHWPWKTLEEVLDYRIKPTGMTFEEFSTKKLFDIEPHEDKPYEKEGFLTPTGKVELSSTIMEKLGYDPLPFYEEPYESPVRTPELAKKYPYITITPKSVYFRHSSHRNNASLRKRHPDPIVQMHPETAKKHGIKDGDWVWIENDRGRIKQKCQIFDKILPQVISCDFGWWFPEKPGEEPSLFGIWESNINVLSCDDLEACGRTSGNWYLSVFQTKISKVT